MSREEDIRFLQVAVRHQLVSEADARAALRVCDERETSGVQRPSVGALLARQGTITVAQVERIQTQLASAPASIDDTAHAAPAPAAESPSRRVPGRRQPSTRVPRRGRSMRSSRGSSRGSSRDTSASDTRSRRGGLSAAPRDAFRSRATILAVLLFIGFALALLALFGGDDEGRGGGKLTLGVTCAGYLLLGIGCATGQRWAAMVTAILAGLGALVWGGFLVLAVIVLSQVEDSRAWLLAIVPFFAFALFAVVTALAIWALMAPTANSASLASSRRAPPRGLAGRRRR